MSIVTETFINCDGCGANYGIDNRQKTGKEHRECAKREGWKVINGKDYCPECKRPKRKTNDTDNK